MKKDLGEAKPRLILQDICPQSDTKVVKGFILEKQGLIHWEEVLDQVVPAGTTIQAGSIVEKTDLQVKKTPRVFVDAGEKRHFNLEDVFDKQVQYFSASPKEGIPGQPAIVADVLRSHGIHCFEQVVENDMGYDPLLGDPKKKRGQIKAQDLLKVYAVDINEFNGWIEASKKIVNS